jgi:NTE family protein
MKTALVLSAGGMFGAYQAGVWSVLADCFEPDLIVGASIGAVNGWSIAGGCPPQELIERWLTLECAQRYSVRFPRAIHGGVLDCRQLMALVDETYRRFKPRIDYAAIVTELRTLQPRIVRREQVTGETLRASTAIFGLFDQVRMGGKLYSDGGLLSAMPIWAAAELGATRVIAVDALVSLPGLIPNAFVSVVRRLSRFHATVAPEVEVLRIAPPKRLGSGRDLLYWSREKAERWIEQGKRDAARAALPLCHPVQ